MPVEAAGSKIKRVLMNDIFFVISACRTVYSWSVSVRLGQSAAFVLGQLAVRFM